MCKNFNDQNSPVSDQNSPVIFGIPIFVVTSLKLIHLPQFVQIINFYCRTPMSNG